VPLLCETMKSEAWRAMSSYARVVYIALRSRYSHTARNNGRIYLSTRDGAEETGFNDKTVARSLRELKHYGFTVMTEPGCLGVEGKGKAPHWRLTELGYMHDRPTKDFLKWNGELFHEQKSPEYYKRQERRLAKLRTGQKQNPTPARGALCTSPRCIPVLQGTEQLPEELHQPMVHVDVTACTNPRCISRVNHSACAESLVDDTAKPAWFSPVLLELPWDDHWEQFYRWTVQSVCGSSQRLAAAW
jgi:hypothetical protein